MTATEPDFARFTEEENQHVETIIARGIPQLRQAGVRYKPIDLRMDLSAVHARCPLRLAEFAAADDFNFAHDVAGIVGNLNRQTGDLENYFLPRFAR